MNNRLLLLKLHLFFILSTLVLLGCKPTKEVAKKIPPKPKNTKTLIEELKKNEFDFEWLSMKINAEVVNEGKNNSFKANIRIRKDSLIWVSITPLMGIEAVRLLITPDTVKAVNRIESTYFIGGYDFLSKKLNVDVSFESLQAMLIGNSMDLDFGDDPPKVSMDKGRYFISSFKKGKLKRTLHKRERFEEKGKAEKLEKKSEKFDHIVHSLWLNSQNFKILKQSVNDLKLQRSFVSEYREFKDVEDAAAPDSTQLFPHLVRYVVSGTQQLEATITVTKVKMNEPKKLPFKIPEKYEQIF
ncbi:MAG: hypothetical protein COA57_03535 [Flavobacteriales bacterium]|nr:MAG: hypothetical protein COA57_03535 [Flavobacteriales bacterium]